MSGTTHQISTPLPQVVLLITATFLRGAAGGKELTLTLTAARGSASLAERGGEKRGFHTRSEHPFNAVSNKG